MASIRATCPSCGEVELAADGVLLALRTGKDEGTYSFVCPGCRQVVRKPADRNIVALLMSAGASVEDDGETADAAPESRPGGPPFTSDDVIDFHFLLESPDWFRHLEAAASR